MTLWLGAAIAVISRSKEPVPRAAAEEKGALPGAGRQSVSRPSTDQQTAPPWDEIPDG